MSTITSHNMVRRHKTAFVFWSAVLLSLISLSLIAAIGPVSVMLIALSALYNIWCIRKSDRGGFIRSKEMRRAHEPARRLNGLQTFVLLLLVMCQIGVGTFVLLT